MSVSSSTVALFTVAFLLGTVIDGVQSADCSTLDLMEDFDINKMVGVWNEVLISKNQGDVGDTYSCIVDKYSKNSNGTILVDHAVSKSSIQFEIVFSPDMPSVLNFTLVQFGGVIVRYVLDTDYENYAILAYCDDSEVKIDVFSHDKQLSADADQKVHKELDSQDLSYDDLVKVDQSKC